MSTELGAQVGGRLTAGYWFGCDCLWGLEGSIFFLGERGTHFTASAPPLPVVARPFINALDGSNLVEIPGMPGMIHIDATSELWGTEIDVRRNLWCGCMFKVGLLAGVRYLKLQEGLHITEEGIAPANSLFPPPGSVGVTMDMFDTRNQFFGGQLGLVTEFHKGCWYVELRTKVALGETHQVLDINGGQTINGIPQISPPGGPGGLLALSSNIGHYSRNRFSVVPEVGLNVGYDITPHVRVFVGYNFLFWSNVLRPGDQIDPIIDPRRIPNFSTAAALAGMPLPSFAQVPPIARPSVPFKQADFWAQGVNCGLEFHY
jgi:hypothetical protein